MTNKKKGIFEEAISCTEGCIFTEPVFGSISDMYDHNQYDNYIRKFIPKNCDERLYAILNVLILEDKISRLREIIDNNRENIFTLDVIKTEKGRFVDMCDYINSFKLIPSHLLDISKRIYKIRNIFIHDLECVDFEILNKKYIDDCKNLLKASRDFGNISGYIFFTDKLTNEVFRKFIFLCDAGINAYLFAVKLWKKDQSSKNLEYYKKIASELNEVEEKDILSNTPEVTYENGTKVERFPKGVIKVYGNYNIK